MLGPWRVELRRIRRCSLVGVGVALVYWVGLVGLWELLGRDDPRVLLFLLSVAIDVGLSGPSLAPWLPKTNLTFLSWWWWPKTVIVPNPKVNVASIRVTIVMASLHRARILRLLYFCITLSTLHSDTCVFQMTQTDTNKEELVSFIVHYYHNKKE